MTKSILAACVACVVLSSGVQADHVKVTIGGQIEFWMEGRVADPKAPIVSVSHEKFRNIKLNLPYRRPGLMAIEEIIQVPTRREQFSRQFSKAQKAGVAERIDVAVWAVKHGMVSEFYKAIDLVLESEPDNARAKQIIALRDKLAQPIADSSAEQKQLADELGSGMKFKTSAHYIVAYDTPDNKAQERLDLLERVYETFFMFFAMKGRVLEPPPQRMMVVLFNEHKNYLDYSTRLDPELSHTAGYYVPETNIAVFFAQGTYPIFKELKTASDTLEQYKKDAERRGDRDRGDLVRFADTIKLLTQVAEEDEDLEVVTHEATHQVAGNSGLFPRRIRIPKSVQEGLAAFFEAPSDASWSGVGAINATRLGYYRVLEKDRVHSDIDFIVSDQIYSRAASGLGIMHAYGQAWGLTHFLVETHFDELNEYWRNLARLPADMVVGEDDLVRCFDAAFGKDRSKLDQEWRRHMNGMQTDMEKLKKDYGKGG